MTPRQSAWILTVLMAALIVVCALALVSVGLGR